MNSYVYNCNPYCTDLCVGHVSKDAVIHLRLGVEYLWTFMSNFDGCQHGKWLFMSNWCRVSGESIQFVYNIHKRKGGGRWIWVPPGTNSWHHKRNKYYFKIWKGVTFVTIVSGKGQRSWGGKSPLKHICGPRVCWIWNWWSKWRCRHKSNFGIPCYNATVGKRTVAPKAQLGPLTMTPGKLGRWPPSSFREKLRKCKCELKSNFGVWLWIKSGQGTVTPKRTSSAPKHYSCVTWLKSIHCFQGTGPE